MGCFPDYHKSSQTQTAGTGIASAGQCKVCLRLDMRGNDESGFKIQSNNVYVSLREVGIRAFEASQVQIVGLDAASNACAPALGA